MNEYLDKVMTLEVPFVLALAVSGALSLIGWLALYVFKLCVRQLESRPEVKQLLKLLDQPEEWEHKNDLGDAVLKRSGIMLKLDDKGYFYAWVNGSRVDVSLGVLETVRLKSKFKKCYNKKANHWVKEAFDKAFNNNEITHL